MADLKFRIKAQAERATKTIVKARNFEFIVDEPEDLGGKDEAANPVEYLLGALAGCLNVLGHVVASEMKFELKGLKMDIVGDLNPACLFGMSFDERAGYKSIEVTLKPEADVDADTLKAWTEAIESRCPLCDNLKHATPINLKIK